MKPLLTLEKKNKFLNLEQLLLFISVSSSILIFWGVYSNRVDRHSDKGFLSIVGEIVLFSALLTVFFAGPKIVAFLKLLCVLSLSIILFIMVSFPIVGEIVAVGGEIGNIAGCVLMSLFFTTTVFLNVRLVICFPNNTIAFICFSLIPLLQFLIFQLFWDGMIAHDYGIQLSLTTFSLLVCFTIGILNHQRQHTQWQQ